MSCQQKRAPYSPWLPSLPLSTLSTKWDPGWKTEKKKRKREIESLKVSDLWLGRKTGPARLPGGPTRARLAINTTTRRWWQRQQRRWLTFPQLPYFNVASVVIKKLFSVFAYHFTSACTVPGTACEVEGLTVIYPHAAITTLCASILVAGNCRALSTVELNTAPS